MAHFSALLLCVSLLACGDTQNNPVVNSLVPDPFDGVQLLQIRMEVDSPTADLDHAHTTEHAIYQFAAGRYTFRVDTLPTDANLLLPHTVDRWQSTGGYQVLGADYTTESSAGLVLGRFEIAWTRDFCNECTFQVSRDGTAGWHPLSATSSTLHITFWEDPALGVLAQFEGGRSVYQVTRLPAASRYGMGGGS